MNELATNIEYMLLSRNCVIVPSLGAFRVVETPPRWVEAEHLFLPPVRQVSFDAHECTDADETFVRSMAQCYGMTEMKALQHCEQLVADFHKALISEGTLDFGSIGVFTLEDDAEISLSSCECGVLSPSYYGLDAVLFAPLAADEKAHKPSMKAIETTSSATAENENPSPTTPYLNNSAKIQHKTATRMEPQDDTHYVIRLPKTVVNYVLAIAATLLLFFVLKPTMTSVSGDCRSNKAQTPLFLQPNMVMRGATDATTTTLDAEKPCVEVKDETFKETGNEVKTPVKTAPVPSPAKAQPAANAANAQPTANTAQTQPVTAQAASSAPIGPYCIILASGVSKANADAFVQRLNKLNINAKVVEGKLRRVMIVGFATEADARSHMNIIKEKSSELSAAWIMKQ